MSDFAFSTPSFTGRRLRFAGGCVHCDAATVSVSGESLRVGPAEPQAAGDLILMPPLANAHDHVRGVRPTSLAAFDMPLELWLATMTGTPACDPYLVAVAALGRQALSGCGSIMIHYTRPQNAARIAEELRVVARAARTVGVRVAIAPALRDRNLLGYLPNEEVLSRLPAEARAALEARLLSTPPAPAAEQVALVDELAAAIDDPLIDVQYGPYGLEWCSDALLRAISEASATHDRRVHMHLLESPIQREYLDAAFPQGPLRYLDEIGLLSPRLSVGHAVWLRPDEMELLAERGVVVSVNTSSNLGLRNGIAPMGEFHRRGVQFAQGLDGFSPNDDDDAFAELRLNWNLHRGVGLQRGVTLDAMFDAACHNGRFAVTGDAGHDTALLDGGTADFLGLDRRKLVAENAIETDDHSLVALRATRAAVLHSVVAGRQIVRDGRLTGCDLDAVQAELAAQVRHGAEGYRDWRDVTQAWTKVLGEAYAAGLHRRP